MTTWEAIAERVRELPPDRQQEVLDFVEVIRSRVEPRGSRQSPGGLWKDLAVDLTEDDIAEARREMWSGFPRDDI